MTHAECDSLLVELSYGELAPDLARRVEDHVAGCEACTRALEGIRGTLSAVRSLPAEEPPEAGVDSLLMYAEQQAARMKERRKGLLPGWLSHALFQPGWALAGIAVVVGLASYAFVEMTRPDPAASSQEGVPAAPVAAKAEARRQAEAPGSAPAAREELQEARASAVTAAPQVPGPASRDGREMDAEASDSIGTAASGASVRQGRLMAGAGSGEGAAVAQEREPPVKGLAGASFGAAEAPARGAAVARDEAPAAELAADDDDGAGRRDAAGLLAASEVKEADARKPALERKVDAGAAGKRALPPSGAQPLDDRARAMAMPSAAQAPVDRATSMAMPPSAAPVPGDGAPAMAPPPVLPRSAGPTGAAPAPAEESAAVEEREVRRAPVAPASPPAPKAKKQGERAAEHARTVASAAAEVEATFERAQAELRASRLEAALALFLKVADEHPRSSRAPDALLAAANIERSRGHAAEADALVSRLLRGYGSSDAARRAREIAR